MPPPDEALELADRLRTTRRNRAAAAAGAAELLPAGLRIGTHETGHDTVGLPGLPATLEAKLELAGPEFVRPDLAGKDVTFKVDGRSSVLARPTPMEWPG
jgi:hypothetical protein